ncbi:MAG: tRNA lysidine(34) synthetase TilS [Roseicyclus sp.]|nr:tRNA lysidine(34) synthetase TilS [Roseicyclus sp.]
MPNAGVWAASESFGVTTSLADRFSGHMGRLLGPEFPTTIGLAVSGGADSMAMLVLAHEWARIYGVGLRVVTVDHGLRPEAAAEAAMVAAESAALGHSHDTLHWHWDKQGNLQDSARQARLDMIGAWRGDVAHVLFAHTQNDQGETLLMRLARGSGVEGLSAMTETRRVAGGWQLIRPLLTETRAELRHHVDVLQVPYVDDPSNEDDSYERVRTRKAVASLGLDLAALADTATRMGRAKVALAARAAEVAARCVSEDLWEGKPTGDLLFERDVFADVERDTQLRLLAAALQWVASADYRPRAKALEGLLERILGGAGGTLHGAQVSVTPTTFRVAREFAAVCKHSVTLEGVTVWDRRWRISSTKYDGLTIRALGPDGWQQLPERPAGYPPHDAAIVRPALFDADRLVAFDMITKEPRFSANLAPRAASFVASLLSR